MLASRKKKAVKRFLRAIPDRLLETVTSVCTDMAKAFTAAARAVVPAARLIIDRFHVARLYGESADRIRRRERRRLEKQLSKADYEADVAGRTWLLRAKKGTLEPEDQARLERFFARAPEAQRAWTLREELRELFEQRLTKQEARAALVAWSAKARVLAGYGTFCETLTTWIEEITNYFVDRETSGFVEGLNNKLKVLKRRCYGLTNVEDFHRRIILDVTGPYAFGLR